MLYSHIAMHGIHNTKQLQYHTPICTQYCPVFSFLQLRHQQTSCIFLFPCTCYMPHPSRPFDMTILTALVKEDKSPISSSRNFLQYLLPLIPVAFYYRSISICQSLLLYRSPVHIIYRYVHFVKK